MYKRERLMEHVYTPVKSNKVEWENRAGPSRPNETGLWGRHVLLGQFLHQQTHGVHHCPHIKQVFPDQLSGNKVLEKNIRYLETGIKYMIMVNVTIPT